ncbi:Copper binding protein, plastocyanin/azurin family [Pseudomonas benzenivorans]|nr:cupredoxin family protein [Pseudomonas benzenivorans]SDH12722.1 Copper binding protein, plastocyanin/azurin family [Pseudomonas benzenivorans]
MTKRKQLIGAALVLAGLTGSTQLLAHGGMLADAHAEEVQVLKEQKDWGIAGERDQVDRTIEIRMTDQMRFTPDRLQVRLGETIRFVHRNDGQMLHEFVLGTRPMLEEHAALMVKFPGMEHDEPYLAHVGPGQGGEIVWTFNRAGEFDFACLIAGHYQAGMVGRISVVAK